MRQNEPTPTILQYATSRRSSRRVCATAFAIALAIYSGTWLVAAALADKSGVYFSNLTGHNVRFASHEHWPRPMQLLFEPAYRIDRWVRPHYWAWDGPFEL